MVNATVLEIKDATTVVSRRTNTAERNAARLVALLPGIYFVIRFCMPLNFITKNFLPCLHFDSFGSILEQYRESVCNFRLKHGEVWPVVTAAG